MHVHLEYFEDPIILRQLVAQGITLVRNMDGRPYILNWRDRTASGVLLGPRIVTAGPILDGDPRCAMTISPSEVRRPPETRSVVRGTPDMTSSKSTRISVAMPTTPSSMRREPGGSRLPDTSRALSERRR